MRYAHLSLFGSRSPFHIQSGGNRLFLSSTLSLLIFSNTIDLGHKVDERANTPAMSVRNLWDKLADKENHELDYSSCSNQGGQLDIV